MVIRKYNLSNTRKRIILALMKIRDQWEDVYRSILQLFLGTYMVWDARRLRLCDRYFESDEASDRVTSSGCPNWVKSKDDYGTD